jgi:hypothetical protein
MFFKEFALSHRLLQVYQKIKGISLRTKLIFFGSRRAKAFRQGRDYFTTQPIAGYIGWLGYENFGDEALYIAFKNLFPQFQILTYNNYPKQLNYNKIRQNIYPIELLFYRHFIKKNNFYNFVFLGGGTLINHEEFLEYLQIVLQNQDQIIVFGSGVSEPSFRAEHHPEVNYSQLMKDWISVLEKAVYVSVRGPKSARILEANGFQKAKVIGDPALSLCTPKPPNSSRTGLVAINLCSQRLMWGKQERVTEIIAQLAKYFLEKGWDVEFIPMQPVDLHLGLKIIQDFNLPKMSIWRNFQDIGKTINRIQTYDIMVGQRLHSVVIACGCGVPSIMLEYQPKCGDFMESIGMQQFSLRTDALELDKVISLIHDIDENYGEYCNQLLSICNSYRILQRQAAQEIINILHSGQFGD